MREPPSWAGSRFRGGLHRLHTVRLDLLTTLYQAGKRRGRLLTPYREHCSKHFAETFSRIGLPRPYETL